MNIHYKIVEVWPEIHSIVVRYWTDILSEEYLASDTNRKEDGTPYRCRSDASITLAIPAPTGEELEKLLISNAPYHWLKTLETCVLPEVDTSLSHISTDVTNSISEEEFLKLTMKTFDLADKPPENVISGTMTDEDIEKLIAKLAETNSAK